jgi:hypothetical protein
MRSNRLWIGLSCGVALGLGAVVAVDMGTQTASAQSANFTVSAQQLKINQNISSAAVKRSNRALNYLAPIRTTQTDNADTGSNGVKPLSSIPGSGDGWTVAQLDEGQKQYWMNVSSTGAMTASSGPTGTGAFTAARTAVGNHTLNFQTNVSACSWTASPTFPAPPGAALIAVPIGLPGQPTQIQIRTGTPAGVPTDSNFTVQVLC